MQSDVLWKEGGKKGGFLVPVKEQKKRLEFEQVLVEATDWARRAPLDVASLMERVTTFQLLEFLDLGCKANDAIFDYI